MSLMGGYGSGHKLDFTGDPAIVCAQRARKKRYEQETNSVQDDYTPHDDYMEKEFQEEQKRHDEETKRLEDKLSNIEREHHRSDVDKDLKIADLERQVRKLTDEGHIVINVNLKSRESINRAKRIINAIDGDNVE